MKLKELREKKGILQIDVANAIGVTNSTYAYYERGERKPTPEMLCKLANFFDVSVDEILGRVAEQRLFDDARIQQEKVIKLYNQLSPHQQELILERMSGYIEGNNERLAYEYKNLSDFVYPKNNKEYTDF